MINPIVFIADAHKLTSEGIKSILANKTDARVTAEAVNSAGLRAQFASAQPDVVIIDCFIPGYFSIEDIAFIKNQAPETGILVITTNKNKEDVLRVLDYGVNSYLLKECDEEEVINAVNATATGRKFFCGKVMDAILEKVTHKCAPDSVCNHCHAVALSEREEEIIRLIADGLTTKEIAVKLNLSFYTISTHRKNVFKKLRIRNSSELIGYALKKGIISAPEITQYLN